MDTEQSGGTPGGDAPSGPDAPPAPGGGQDFAHRVVRLGALAEPVRRRLYQYVAAQPEPVSRDQAAGATGVPRHTAKFHLDRLVAEGLLEASARRLSGRSGPGAGRPAKLYRRASAEVAVSLPERHYELAGRIMAEAIDRSTVDGAPVLDVLTDVAAARGRELGRTAPVADGGSGLSTVCGLLADLGYEPRAEGDDVVLANCPFHALVADHTALVCGMNLALLDAVAGAAGPDGPHARLDPAPGRCCVVLSGGSPPDAPVPTDPR